MVCNLCKKQLIQIKDEEKSILYSILDKAKCASLYKLYSHDFEYCPDCLVETIPEDKASIIKDKSQEIMAIYNDEYLEDIDTLKWARIAECVGYCRELLGDNKGAVLAYKASTDILDAMISIYINKNQHTAVENGEDVQILKEEHFKNCKNALIHSKNLKRLTLGHLLKCLDVNDFTLLLIYFDTAIDLELYKPCEQMSQLFAKEKHPVKEYQDAIECLLNKFTSL